MLDLKLIGPDTVGTRISVQVFKKSGVQRLARFLEMELYKRTYRQYFDLSTLRRMGHPYSRRHPPGAAGIPDWLINRQSGQLFEHLRVGMRVTWRGLQLYVQGPPYLQYLEFGTRKMRPRRFVASALEAAVARFRGRESEYLINRRDLEAYFAGKLQMNLPAEFKNPRFVREQP